jgi:N-methylhydantoinase A
VEIVAFRVSATTPLARGSAPPFSVAAAAEPAGERSAWSFARGERCTFATVDRAALAPGDELAGPAIVHEPTATTYLDAGFVARVHAHGHLIVERTGHTAKRTAAEIAEEEA